jgi:hypothetical protein
MFLHFNIAVPPQTIWASNRFSPKMMSDSMPSHVDIQRTGKAHFVTFQNAQRGS